MSQRGGGLKNIIDFSEKLKKDIKKHFEDHMLNIKYVDSDERLKKQSDYNAAYKLRMEQLKINMNYFWKELNTMKTDLRTFYKKIIKKYNKYPNDRVDIKNLLQSIIDKLTIYIRPENLKPYLTTGQITCQARNDNNCLFKPYDVPNHENIITNLMFLIFNPTIFKDKTADVIKLFHIIYNLYVLNIEWTKVLSTSNAPQPPPSRHEPSSRHDPSSPHKPTVNHGEYVEVSDVVDVGEGDEVKNQGYLEISHSNQSPSSP